MRHNANIVVLLLAMAAIVSAQNNTMPLNESQALGNSTDHPSVLKSGNMSSGGGNMSHVSMLMSSFPQIAAQLPYDPVVGSLFKGFINGALLFGKSLLCEGRKLYEIAACKPITAPKPPSHDGSSFPALECADSFVTKESLTQVLRVRLFPYMEKLAALVPVSFQAQNQMANAYLKSALEDGTIEKAIGKLDQDGNGYLSAEELLLPPQEQCQRLAELLEQANQADHKAFDDALNKMFNLGSK